ncbi:MAG: CPBP family intramembrane metalloprotease [Actinobacteria bacterium]|nr:CPBP family intramembrane metalloprotease [Actinomycetota bacterium]
MARADALRSRVDAWVRHAPRPGVRYPEVLVVDDPSVPAWRRVMLGVGGALLGLATYMVLAPLVAFAIIRASWSLAGSPGDVMSYTAQAASFGLPAGMVATHLALATLIPISFALVLFVHRFHPRWLTSVQPGFRWRYALVTGGASLLVFGGVWVVSRIGEPWVVAPEPAFWGYVVAILLTAPLQAAAEEYFFRGYLMQAIHTTAPTSPWFAVVGSSAVFALLHSGNSQALIYAFAFGLIAGWLAMRTGGLEAGIALHVVNNLLTFGYAALSGTMVETFSDRQATWASLAWAVGGFAASAAVALWIARRMRLATTTPGARFGAPAAV